MGGMSVVWPLVEYHLANGLYVSGVAGGYKKSYFNQFELKTAKRSRVPYPISILFVCLFALEKLKILTIGTK